MAASETSWQNSLEYTTSVTGYDARFQVTSSKVTIPGVFGTDPLAGEWKFATTFNQAGQPVTVSTPAGPVDPAVGGDPVWDQSTTQYNSFGQPVQLWPGDPSAGSGTARYVAGTGFDDLGRVTSRTLALATTGDAMQRAYGYNTSTGVLDTIKAGWTTVGGTSTSWFQNDTIARDAVGNVTSVTDNGLEPSGTASSVKECFLYDTRNRLVRAHSAAPAAACATSTAAATVATGTLDAYDQTWTFDDINRITSRTDKLTGTATSFAYTGSKHAVVGLSGGTTATYGYNQVGAMTSRDGTTLTYDTQQRLTSYGTTESYLYGVSNQRVVRTAGTTRTLYLPGMEVTDTAGTVTVTKWLTIGGTTVGTKTVPAGGTASVAWNCGSLQNNVVCQAPAASAGTIPARKRYRPYGDERNTVTLSTTDHGFLNQPEDTTGLTYLNNRYYDPGLGNFTSVDPLVGKTGTPYLYAAGNPATLSDPSGLCWWDLCIAESLLAEYVTGVVVAGLSGVLLAECLKNCSFSIDSPGSPQAAAAKCQSCHSNVVAEYQPRYEYHPRPLQPTVTMNHYGMLVWSATGAMLTNEELAEYQALQARDGDLPARAEPNSTGVKDHGDGTGQIRDYGPDGRATQDFDFGHDHGAGDPHVHDWEWGNELGPRMPGRPLLPGEGVAPGSVYGPPWPGAGGGAAEPASYQPMRLA